MNQSFIFLRTGDCVQRGGIKQGSSHKTIEYDISGTMQYVKQTYHNLLRERVAPELEQEWFYHKICTLNGIGLVR